MKKTSKIYTKNGDKGTTSLIGRNNVSKDNLKIEAYGTLDELNSFIGLLKNKLKNSNDKNSLIRIQKTIFTISTYIAYDEEYEKFPFKKFNNKEILFLEKEIDIIDLQLPKLANFIIPGSDEANSICHICRSITRRTEREIVSLNSKKNIPDFILKYINRLSDYFFILSRKISIDNNSKEIFIKN